jgi:hypothetical protein
MDAKSYKLTVVTDCDSMVEAASVVAATCKEASEAALIGVQYCHDQKGYVFTLESTDADDLEHLVEAIDTAGEDEDEE